MVSRNDAPDAKEMFESVQRFGKDFLEYLYVEVEKDGNFLLPEEAVAAFFRFIRDQPGQPSLSMDLTDLEADRLGRKLYRQLCHDAAAAYIRHTPRLKIEKGKPGRTPNVALAERIWALHDEGETSKKIMDRLKAEEVNLSLEGVEAYLKTRRRPRGR
jgi:hypothetical protein